MQILVIGYYGWKNTGDDAMLYALLEHLKDQFSGVTFNVTVDSEPYAPRDVDLNPVSPGPSLDFIRAFLMSDTLILGGGTHFFDYGRRLPRILRLAQLFLLTLAGRLTGKRVYFLGVGVERPGYWWSRFLIRNTCRLASRIFVRDSSSLEVLEEMGVDGILSADLSFYLEYERTKRERGLLGISAMPYFKIYSAADGGDEVIVEAFRSAVSRWLELNPENRVKLFVFNGRPPHDDREISMRIAEMVNDERVTIHDYREDPRETLKNVGSCGAFIAMKFHAAVFAYLNDLPAIIVEYADKNRALVEDAGFPERSHMTLDDITAGKLAERVEDLYRNPESYRAQRKAEEIMGKFPRLDEA
ncbi:polysaccharide pyruvyl transferase family protein [Methanothermobacter sp. K4]|uniref:polysaccharide pyruvyl transferase family protein n=1 Tax=Methanothermobacter sp. K4 TaxID=2913262 RepID=UPI001EDC55DC|nr:polysaccharide pyruvyl transferase family protein [Methanothermobacter sp. K4]MCG2828371.1 polysaccharide pyruvyl transferase family protein [Methanothermobacter sp. K4]